MAKSINKFIVRLADQTAYKPQLTVAVTFLKETQKHLIKLVHPNTKEIVYSEEYEAKGKNDTAKFMNALSYGKTLLEKPEITAVQSSIEYKEQLFIPQGRRGKMKLKTKEALEKENQEKDRLANPVMDEDLVDIELNDDIEMEVETEEIESLDQSGSNEDLEKELEESEEKLKSILKGKGNSARLKKMSKESMKSESIEKKLVDLDHSKNKKKTKKVVKKKQIKNKKVKEEPKKSKNKKLKRKK